MPKTPRARSVRFVYEDEYETLRTRLPCVPGGLYSYCAIRRAPPFRVRVAQQQVHIAATRAVLLMDAALRGVPIEANLPPHWAWDSEQRLLRVTHSKLSVCIERLEPDDVAVRGLGAAQPGDYRISVYMDAADAPDC